MSLNLSGMILSKLLKLHVMVYHFEPECHAKRLVYYLQGQSQWFIIFKVKVIMKAHSH